MPVKGLIAVVVLVCYDGGVKSLLYVSSTGCKFLQLSLGFICSIAQVAHSPQHPPGVPTIMHSCINTNGWV